MKKLNHYFAIFIGVSLVYMISSCSSLKPLPKPQVLNTEYKEPTYYYCLSESCIKPTKLSKDEYKPLEPDEPLIVPLVKDEPVVKTVNTKPKHKKQVIKRKPKRKPATKPKHIPQCVMWK